MPNRRPKTPPTGSAKLRTWTITANTTIRLAQRADGRGRTGDLRVTKAALYQLSYVGVEPAC